ncbi:MAG: NAD-dependent epimerase/dehydratase family protein [Planctomycetota bacterium JB042]
MSEPRPHSLTLDGKTRVAVVGAGYIADFHLDVLKRIDDVEVVAVCDPARGRAEAAAKAHGVEHVVGDLAELKELGVQIAHLTVPPDLHVDLTNELLDLGIGVFAEKPLALSTEEARALAARAAERRLPLAVNHNNVFHPSFAALARRVAAGEIGRLEHVQVTLSVPLRQLDAGDYTHWMFRAPRNIVFEQATHPFSQLHHLLGRVRSAHTTLLRTRELHPGQVFHDRWLVAAEAERGTAEIYMAFGEPFTRSTLQVLGTDGSLEADLFHDHLSGEEKTLWLDFWNSFLAGWRRGKDQKRCARNNLFDWIGFTLGIRDRRDPFYVGMRDSVRAFHRALRKGAPIPSDAAAATEVIEWCDAAAGDLSAEPPPAPAIPAPGAPRDGEVVLLGATGFIGRRVVEKLVARDVPVTCVVRRFHSLPPAVLEPALAGKVRLVKGSLEDASLRDALKGARACIQLATGGGDTWEAVRRSMIEGSVKVAEACADEGVGRLVYVSSVAALYLGADGGEDVIGDDHPTDPEPEARPVYARGKAAAEAALLETCAARGVGLVLARPGVVLGDGTPMQHSGVGLWVRDNHCVGWGHGDHPLPVVWVDDVAEALVRAALHEGTELDGKAMNLCARPPLSAKEIVEELRADTGRRLHFHGRSLALSQAMEIGKWIVKRVGGRKAPFPSYRDLKSRALAPPFSCERAREVLGWTPVEERGEFLDKAVRVYGPKTDRTSS